MKAVDFMPLLKEIDGLGPQDSTDPADARMRALVKGFVHLAVGIKADLEVIAAAAAASEARATARCPTCGVAGGHATGCLAAP